MSQIIQEGIGILLLAKLLPLGTHYVSCQLLRMPCKLPNQSEGKSTIFFESQTGNLSDNFKVVTIYWISFLNESQKKHCILKQGNDFCFLFSVFSRQKSNVPEFSPHTPVIKNISITVDLFIEGKVQMNHNWENNVQ